MRRQARIDLARRDLMGLIKHTFPSYKVAPHNRFVTDKLMAVERGEITRLMVSMPPRYGKTESVCRFIAWCLGRHPDWPVIYTSYGADLAISKSRVIRGILNSPEFGEVFDTRLSQEASSAAAWEVAEDRGGVVAAGVGSGITGRGFKIGILDDLIKDRRDANSRTIRDYTWEWYQSTFYTRMEEFGAENAAIIFIMTRWHSDDPSGRMLEQMALDPGADRWEVIRLPAIAGEKDLLGRKSGEALWPAKHSLEDLERIRSNIGAWEFEAQFQQNPTPKEGMMFQREWFEIVDQAPADCAKLRYWDLAATEAKKGDPDWTVGALVGEKDGIFYIMDIRRIRTTPLYVENLIRQTAELDRIAYGIDFRVYMEREPGASGVITIDHYRREVLRGFSFREDLVSGSKEVRAEPLSAAAQAGNVKLVRGPWIGEFLDEIENLLHDDQIDTVSGGYNILTRQRRRSAGLDVLSYREPSEEER